MLLMERERSGERLEGWPRIRAIRDSRDIIPEFPHQHDAYQVIVRSHLWRERPSSHSLHLNFDMNSLRFPAKSANQCKGEKGSLKDARIKHDASCMEIKVVYSGLNRRYRHPNLWQIQYPDQSRSERDRKVNRPELRREWYTSTDSA